MPSCGRRVQWSGASLFTIIHGGGCIVLPRMLLIVTGYYVLVRLQHGVNKCRCKGNGSLRNFASYKAADAFGPYVRMCFFAELLGEN